MLHCSTVAVSCLLCCCLKKCISSYALRFFERSFRPRVYFQLPARSRNRFGTPLVRFIAHGIEEKMALLPNLFYIKGDGFARRGSATGIVNGSNFRCQTIKRSGLSSLSCFPKLWCFRRWPRRCVQQLPCMNVSALEFRDMKGHWSTCPEWEMFPKYVSLYVRFRDMLCSPLIV